MKSMAEFDKEFDSAAGPSYCMQCDEPTGSQITMTDDLTGRRGVICHNCDDLNQQGMGS